MRVAEVSCYPLGSTLEGDARARDDAELAEAAERAEEEVRVLRLRAGHHLTLPCEPHVCQSSDPERACMPRSSGQAAERARGELGIINRRQK